MKQVNTVRDDLYGREPREGKEEIVDIHADFSVNEDIDFCVLEHNV